MLGLKKIELYSGLYNDRSKYPLPQIHLPYKLEVDIKICTEISTVQCLQSVIYCLVMAEL